MQRENRYS